MGYGTARFLGPIAAVMVALTWTSTVLAGTLREEVREGNSAKVYKMAEAVDYLLEEADEHNRFPISLAAYEGERGVIAALLKAGDDVDRTGEKGKTPLFWAAVNERNRADTIRLLVDRGAEINHKSDDGFTALQYAVKWGHEANVQALIDLGVDVNAKGKSDLTPLHEVALHPLQERGDNRWGWTASNDKLDILLTAGANPDATSEKQGTPLHFFAEQRFVSRVQESNFPQSFVRDARAFTKTLIEASDVSLRDDLGRTALHYAASSNSPVAAEYLLQAGAQADVEDDSGKTPFDIALEKNNDEVAGVLAE